MPSEYDPACLREIFKLINGKDVRTRFPHLVTRICFLRRIQSHCVYVLFTHFLSVHLANLRVSRRKFSPSAVNHSLGILMNIFDGVSLLLAVGLFGYLLFALLHADRG